MSDALLEDAKDLALDVTAIGLIAVVPKILEIVCQITGMGFAAVARVTPDRWIACDVRDTIGFGLTAGGELKVETTICHDICRNRQTVVFDDASKDPVYAGHHTPLMYGLKSYISVPIIREDGTVFGTLCAIDPNPAKINRPEIIGMFQLYAELIAQHLDGQERLRQSETRLVEAQHAAELREQFIAVLGHDLRNPLGAIASGITLLEKTPLNERGATLVAMMHKSAGRMIELIENVLDFARGRLGGGVTLDVRREANLEHVLTQVISELRVRWPERAIAVDYDLAVPVDCDPSRIAQLFSNLLGNALTYGDPNQPVQVTALSSESRFELSVANGGVPIPAAAMARLFHPFVRGKDSPAQQGLGLGLYIASEIAKAHGGELTARSDARETRFLLRILKPH
ncbi:GAF domain-containing sensor histidine kinase [Asticcacaulis sp. 201]|uniref:GAF domain-containing sensor histidine kinase n=1 Tax=Asticcacaulis sp. 201 TaxID=3028787 RepID=UPI002916C238|nr:GAF domain-containing sensor histidine kinase [Asticcacaulis sp. 201]MDV6329652.1 GAF domain-containing sensor histidine kinase [Asticcacaulis sp. 201]